MRRLVAWFRIAVLVAATLAMLPVQLAAVRFGWPVGRRIPVVFHRLARWALGLRVSVVGAPAAGRPLLIAANHISWADIVVLGSLMPLSFVAKAEVATWPVFGLCARLQRCVFVERERRNRTARQAKEIADRLAAGDTMVLFPEGTSSDGNQVLPFRSALLGAAREAIDAGGHAHVLVQPVAIVYTRLHGLPLDRHLRPRIAWTGDVELVPHLLGVACEGAFDVVVKFGAPVAFDAESSRKHVTAEVERTVRHMVAALVTGRRANPVA